MVLFTHLKIILLQYFQFSIFNFSNNKLNPNGPNMRREEDRDVCLEEGIELFEEGGLSFTFTQWRKRNVRFYVVSCYYNKGVWKEKRKWQNFMV